MSTLDAPSNAAAPGTDGIAAEIAELEERLRDAKLRLRQFPNDNPIPVPVTTPRVTNTDTICPTTNHLHALLLLSDSALPLGSFAYSSGLESFLAHHPRTASSLSPSTQLHHFLALSLNSITATTLPYVIAGLKNPEELEDLDNDLDASTPCTVARRASVKQGLALLAVWERSFRAGYRKITPHTAQSAAAEGELARFSGLLKASSLLPHEEQDATSNMFLPNGHLPPLFGTLCAVLDIPLEEALYLYLLNHCKTVVSAAIRSGVLGPYQAQSFLAGAELRRSIRDIVDREVGGQSGAAMSHGTGKDAQVKSRTAKEATALAGQSVPVLDLWGGRHEIIYSRIFNS